MMKAIDANRIVTAPNGNKYVIFGDSLRQYQILAWPGKAMPDRVNFDVRVDNDPNGTFAEFGITRPENADDGILLAIAMKWAKDIVSLLLTMEKAAGRPDEAYAEGLRHLLQSLDEEL